MTVQSPSIHLRTPGSGVRRPAAEPGVSISSLVALLRCPFCRSGFQFREVARGRLGVAEFGILTCSCDRFPILDGIPIIQRAPVSAFEHTTGAAEASGRSVADLVQMVDAGQTDDALIEALLMPRKLSLPPWVPWRITHGRPAQSLARWRGRDRTKRLLADRHSINAREALDVFYAPDGPLAPDVKDYFALRFGQPRHIAALALLAGMPVGERPVLSIACGIGHLEHYLTARDSPSAVIGFDMNFYHVWLARHWVAPSGVFICGTASERLPFADNAFSATICSDAYHYIGNRAELLRDIARCAPGQPVYLTRVGNRSVGPNEGQEASFEAYLQEFGPVEVRSFPEPFLQRCYLRRVDPLQTAALDAATLTEAKWLSFVLHPSASTRPTPATDAWPHAVGQKALNPIYTLKRCPEGVRLHFQFPAVWFAYENHAMLEYHPHNLVVTNRQLELIAQGRGDDPSIRHLIDSFVVIGIPSRF